MARAAATTTTIARKSRCYSSSYKPPLWPVPFSAACLSVLPSPGPNTAQELLMAAWDVARRRVRGQERDETAAIFDGLQPARHLQGVKSRVTGLIYRQWRWSEAVQPATATRGSSAPRLQTKTRARDRRWREKSIH
uniref:Uncharacterized protein n=1 Tax=Peronospora matthiolae TaxID=2874970 RepID=A0AAV1VBB9_9STRA